MSQNGKGDKRRPIQVAFDTYASNWDRIFKPNPPKKTACKFVCKYRRPPSTHDDPCATCGEPWSKHRHKKGEF